jgi:hypothetical protein
MWQAVKPWRRLRNMVTAAAGLPLRTRHEDSIESLLSRQARKGRGGGIYDKLNWWLRPPVDDRIKPGMQGGPARPETIHDAEIVEPTPPGKGVVISQRRGGRSEGYVNADAWESHAPNSRTAAGTALPVARPEMPGGASDPSEGRPPRGGDPGGSGSGGAGGGVRTEGLPQIALPAGDSPEPTPTRGDVREASRPHADSSTSTASSSAVSGELIVPSRMEQQDDATERWRAAEARDVRKAASRGEGDQEVWEIYRPSTGDVESSGGAGQNTSAHRPEVQGD